MAEDACFLSTLWLWHMLCSFVKRYALNYVSSFIQRDFIKLESHWFIFHSHIHERQFNISNTTVVFFMTFAINVKILYIFFIIFPA